ncbi:cytochrome c peroxidase [Azospirillum sp.]|uniref:cytochrome c peroxidase n=1 Tax=Azospirillum sp. TaxID=34012 RepID=UPI003D715C94
MKRALLPLAALLLASTAMAADLAALRRPATVPFPAETPYSATVIRLGERLFHEPALSGAGDRSCATCHEPAKGFHDGRRSADGLDGKPLDRRTPFIADLAWGERFFWDGRAASLEEQALGPVQNPREMNQTLDGMVAALSANPAYKALFATAFPDEPRVTPGTVARALAAYERTLVSGVAPFDRWAAGDEGAVPETAKRGFALFSGKAGCANCHSGWAFTDHAFHDIGLPGDGRGRGAVLGEAKLNHAFKTPALRDVGRHAPYMHDGSLATLEAVLDHYAGRFVERPTLSPDLPRLTLTAAEKADLLAFLRSLDTDAPPPVLVPETATATVAALTAPPEIGQRDKRFSLSEVRIKAGQALRVHNNDVRDHNVRYERDGREFNSGIQEPGQSVSVPFTEAGTYRVFCGIHPKMKLRVDVE